MRPRTAFRSFYLLLGLATWTPALAIDTQPPICRSSISGSGTSAIVDGSATDRGGGETGIVSVVLDPASVNLACQGCAPAPLSNPASKVTFTLHLADAADPFGRGAAIVTDGAGHTCNVGFSSVPIAQGPVLNQPLVIDPVRTVKLYVLEGDAPSPGVAVTAYTPPTSDDISCLPDCFEFEPGTQALTVDSPIEGPASVSLDSPGINTRLLFRHPTECPFFDFSQSFQDPVSDGRVTGKPTWSRVEFATGRQIAGCTVQKKADKDEDGFFFGGSTTADCNDANAGINPGATEICNGLDDDCDAAMDESGCGTIRVEAILNVVGGESHSTGHQALAGAEIRLYDAGPTSCAASKGTSPKDYRAIFGEGTFANPGCVSVTSALTDATGLATFHAAPGDYIVIGRPGAPYEAALIGSTLGTLVEGDVVTIQIQLVVDEDGNVVSSRTDP